MNYSKAYLLNYNIHKWPKKRHKQIARSTLIPFLNTPVCVHHVFVPLCECGSIPFFSKDIYWWFPYLLRSVISCDIFYACQWNENCASDKQIDKGGISTCDKIHNTVLDLSSPAYDFILCFKEQMKSNIAILSSKYG